MRRRTRFVCVSDTHGYTPSEAGFKLPAGDVLIHAGDLTNSGSSTELRKTVDWISKADFETKIIVAGNHDVSLDAEFYATHGQAFHGQRLEDPQRCQKMVTGSDPSVVLLQHQSAVIRLTRPEGPKTAFKVFGSPYSQFEGNWGFGYGSNDAATLWDQIPFDTDIIVTHTPAYSHCDLKPTGRFVGCEMLRQRLSRIRPQLAVCGHVHEGRGYERVRWRSALIGTKGEDEGVDTVIRGVLPRLASKKQSLVDLTGKRGERLSNDGSSWSTSSPHDVLTTGSTSLALTGSAENAMLNLNDPSVSSDCTVDTPLGHALQTLRRETCIVNAAIVATSWPHRGGKRFNAPIVVDLELPVWQSGPHADGIVT